MNLISDKQSHKFQYGLKKKEKEKKKSLFDFHEHLFHEWRLNQTSLG